jgi:hypothetical protein
MKQTFITIAILVLFIAAARAANTNASPRAVTSALERLLVCTKTAHVNLVEKRHSGLCGAPLIWPARNG